MNDKRDKYKAIAKQMGLKTQNPSFAVTDAEYFNKCMTALRGGIENGVVANAALVEFMALGKLGKNPAKGDLNIIQDFVGHINSGINLGNRDDYDSSLAKIKSADKAKGEKSFLNHLFGDGSAVNKAFNEAVIDALRRQFAEKKVDTVQKTVEVKRGREKIQSSAPGKTTAAAPATTAKNTAPARRFGFGFGKK